MDFARNEAVSPLSPAARARTKNSPGQSNFHRSHDGDTKALQSVLLFPGAKLRRSLDIKFLDENNQLQYAWTTSWRISTRFIAHYHDPRDDQGLVLPLKLPFQVVIVPIYRKDEEKERLCKSAGSGSRTRSFSRQSG